MKKSTVSFILIITMVLTLMQNSVSLYAAETLEIQSSPISIGDVGMAVKEDGGLYIWGNTPSEKKYIFKSAAESEKIMDSAAAVSAGLNFETAITTDGSLYTWGDNSCGQLGNGTYESINTPQKIMDDAVAVSAGDFHCLALKSDGSLYAWGSNAGGQLGTDTCDKSNTPLKIMEGIKAISAGCSYSMALKSDGSLYIWGDNYTNALGVTDKYGAETTKIDEPRKIMDNVVSMSAGAFHSLAITADGSLYAWGDNAYGALGIGAAGVSSVISTPQKVLNNAAYAAAGRYNSLAVTTDGGLYTWGCNSGDGTNEGSYSPYRIMDNVAAVSANINQCQSMAVTADGDLYVWGFNDFGSLGDETNETLLSPKKILSNIMLPDDINISGYTAENNTEDINLIPIIETSYSVYIDDELIETDIKPVTVDGAVFVPVRPLFEAMGYEVTWSSFCRINIVNDDLAVNMSAGDRLIQCLTRDLDNKFIYSTLPPRIINGSAYIYLEDFTEILSASRSIDSEADAINISLS